MTLYKGKYRIETTRLQTWDYSSNGFYFVTICTAHRQPFFGEISNDEVRLSDIGLIAYEEWLKSAQLRQNIKLDAFVIMPNHMHGIVVICNPDKDAPGRDALRGVSTNQFGPLPSGSLQSMINGYKGAVTRWCKNNGYAEFAWLARFWDHIIRNEEKLQAIREYIINNPRKWALDNENAAGLWM